jgi:hypothetical protein
MDLCETPDDCIYRPEGGDRGEDTAIIKILIKKVLPKYV